MIIKTIETFKTIKMSTDNSVIPELVMVLTVLTVLTVIKNLAKVAICINCYIFVL